VLAYDPGLLEGIFKTDPERSEPRFGERAGDAL